MESQIDPNRRPSLANGRPRPPVPMVAYLGRAPAALGERCVGGKQVDGLKTCRVAVVAGPGRGDRGWR